MSNAQSGQEHTPQQPAPKAWRIMADIVMHVVYTAGAVIIYAWYMHAIINY